MRIHNRSTLIDYIENYPLADKSLRPWYANTEKASWENSAALKEQYGNASIIKYKRVVFNIHGNAFRLVVDVEFLFQKVFIVWFGTHNEYDKIKVEKLKYVKINKN
jgi:mRNA-degrading endonuclease HigB of HigAB toxin-antitoxin module